MKTSPPHGKVKKTKKKTGKAKTCGAAGRTCLCGHHRNQHAAKIGRCWDCDQAAKQVGLGHSNCEAFRAKPCAVNKLLPNGRCRSHGGKTPAGIASPNWRNGRWAKGMKNLGLRDGFYAALTDPNLEKTRQDLAMLDALVNSLAASLGVKGITESQERRMSKLVELRQQALERQARIEQRLGQWIHFSKYQAVMMGLVNILTDELKTPEGQPMTAILVKVQKRMETLFMGLAIGQADKSEAEDGDAE